MDQNDFSREFQRRFPFGDVIPAVLEYVNGSDPTYNGIPDLPPEPFTMDGPELVKEEIAAPVWPCRGCGKAFPIAIARAGHERFCKSIVRKKEATHASQ
jgi:hypothetical protein